MDDDYYSSTNTVIYEASHSALAVEYLVLVVVSSYILAKLLKHGQTYAYKILFLTLVIFSAIGLFKNIIDFKTKCEINV